MRINTAKQMQRAAIRLAGSTGKSGSGGQVSKEYQRGWRAASRYISSTLRQAEDYRPAK